MSTGFPVQLMKPLLVSTAGQGGCWLLGTEFGFQGSVALTMTGASGNCESVVGCVEAVSRYWRLIVLSCIKFRRGFRT